MTMYRAFALATLVATTLSLRAQDPQELIKSLRRENSVLADQLADERARLLLEVRVNGSHLDPKEVMREAIYLTGGKLVEAKVAEFFILEEMTAQIDTGKRRPDDFKVADDEVLGQLAPMKAEFESKNPGVDFWSVVRSQYGLDKDTFLEERKRSILFDKVFFPGQPKDWPDITKEAIKAETNSEQGGEFIEKLQEATEGTDQNGNPRKLPDFWVNMMRQFVQKGLRKWSDIRYGSHGLPADIVLRVNNYEWTTDDAFRFVKKGLYVQDLERAMQEVAVREALRQELVAKGVLVSDELFQQRYDEYRAPYDNTPFTVEIIATRFKGYPCLEAFRARWRLMTSYSDLIADEITDANLQAHADRFAAFFADGQCSIDVIPFQARDTQTGAWKPDGMEQAKARADAVFANLASKEITFEEALVKHGEFFVNDEKRGRLGFLPLNQLKQQLRESEYTQLLDGFSVSHYLFFDAAVGQAHGPIAGPDGWFIARINTRTPPRKKIDVKNEKERELVREDFVNYRFFQWANEVIARSKFE
jgi:hypothetical protein